jgi:glycosyltransferase involved in cell wall biosynthesis
MKHLVISRLWFDSRELMDKYIDIALNTFIPSLKAQTCKNFDFGLLIRKEDVEYVRKKIGMDFIAFTEGIEQYRKVPKKYGYTLQTRHDFDDWMRKDYIETIQNIYKENKDKYKSFVIHAQPVKVTYPDMKPAKTSTYHDTRISMFATLAQREPDMPIYKGSHGQLYKYAEKVFLLPKGYCKWVQHPDTVTNARLKKKMRAGGELMIRKVGSMELYDTDHNWISERNIDPVVNILTRTFRRPKSFKICRDSVLSQTYIQGEGKFNDRSMKINHIVGCEEKCSYYPNAIKVTKKEGKFLPWNLHLNDLGKKVKTGWVMYLDDDDMLMRDTSVEEMVAEIDHEDQLLIWKVRISSWTAPNEKHFGKVIKRGQVSGIGVLFHGKHLPVPWEARPAGDFHVIEHLSKKLEVKWVDKVLTGTQGGKNHHGKTLEIENLQAPQVLRKDKSDKVSDNLVTVGTPTWNNANIFWLSIESLCRQETTVPWEYIVMECPGAKSIGKDYIKQYERRLKAAGCVRITYINLGKRLDLSTKWKYIADKARGKILILHDSDDYTHPLRIQRTVEMIGDRPWYDTRYAWHYSIPDKKLIEFDYLTVNKWKTGFNIGLLTDIVRKANDRHINKGMHKWMSEYINDKYMDEEKYPCVATTGANTVSLNRITAFTKQRPPWVKTDKTIYDIGLPEDVVERLVKNDHVPSLEVLRDNSKVEVRFKKKYCRLFAEGEVKKISRQAFYNLQKKGYVELLNEPTYEPIEQVI